MAGYSSFSLKSVKKTFGLTERKQALFPEVMRLEPSTWLLETLAKSKRIVALNNEKSRSEFIIAPILSEITDQNLDKISFYSGENLEGDKEQSLSGECDYIFSKIPESSTIEAPIICMVEAENDNISTGLGQCVAQLIGAQLFNQREGNDLPILYGCVTTGSDWKFMKLEGKTITIDTETYYVDNLSTILGNFQKIISSFF